MVFSSVRRAPIVVGTVALWLRLLAVMAVVFMLLGLASNYIIYCDCRGDYAGAGVYYGDRSTILSDETREHHKSQTLADRRAHEMDTATLTNDPIIRLDVRGQSSFS